MKRLLPLNAAALAVALLACAPARADLIKWSYRWDAPAFVYASPTGSDTGGIVLFKTDGRHVSQASTDVVAANLKEVSDAKVASPDVFGPDQGKFTLTLTIKDDLSKLSDKLSFTGQLKGSFSATTSGVGVDWLTPTTEVMQLGTSKFIVTVNSFLPPGPASQKNQGGIGAHVEVIDPPSPNPEPSALLLAGVGAALAGAAWRKRRRKAQAGTDGVTG
jgi:hypothetical protein